MHNKKELVNNIITYGVIVLIAIIVFFILGEEVPLIERDTEVYTTISSCDGVMPIYPLYSLLCKKIFGLSNAFYAMTIIQGIIAACSTIGLTIYIKKVCNLGGITTIIVYILSLMPFVVYLPKANISQIILTESLAFPGTYLMFYFLLKSFVDEKIRYSVYAIISAMLLYLIRSQLLIAILFACFIFFIQLVRLYNNNWWKFIVKLMIAMAITIIAFVIPYKLFMGYVNFLAPTIANNISAEDNNSATVEFNTVSDSSQFGRLIMNRGILLFHLDDSESYSDIEEKEAYLAAYNNIINNNPDGILERKEIDWTIKPDDQGLFFERNFNYAVDGMTEYYIEKGQNLSDDIIWIKVSSLLMKYSVRAFFKHPFLAIGLFARLFFAGIQAAIFFQPEGYYVISEVLTGILIIVTLLLLFFRRSKKDPAQYILLTSSLAVLVYAGIVSAIHQPLQRYLIYFQGVFYIGIFISLLKLFVEIRHEKERKYNESQEY